MLTKEQEHHAPWRSLTRLGALGARCAWMPVPPMPFWAPTNACTPSWLSIAPDANCVFRSVLWIASNWFMQVMELQRAGLTGQQFKRTLHAAAMQNTRVDICWPKNRLQMRVKLIHLQCPAFQLAAKTPKNQPLLLSWPKRGPEQLLLLNKRLNCFSLNV